ncbi:uncharacterized protein LOC130850427 isoform X2 [Hippopotamus amphibius kiboko]|uniref:uncharacterized protein LOC130850427 isoform X2 n=1 Tax=Hippopotamus amphibius kiboko TaxID=575201 RepID=UPI00259AE67B|nr:uncharacterized protein LOC130850427 isoform X2 [Hippopotamus amphibius kiboko]
MPCFPVCAGWDARPGPRSRGRRGSPGRTPTRRGGGEDRARVGCRPAEGAARGLGTRGTPSGTGSRFPSPLVLLSRRAAPSSSGFLMFGRVEEARGRGDHVRLFVSPRGSSQRAPAGTREKHHPLSRAPNLFRFREGSWYRLIHIPCITGRGFWPKVRIYTTEQIGSCEAEEPISEGREDVDSSL